MFVVHTGTTVRALRKVDNFGQFYAKQDSAIFEAVLKTKPLQQDIELQKGSRETAGTTEEDLSFTPKLLACILAFLFSLNTRADATSSTWINTIWIEKSFSHGAAAGFRFP